MDTNYSGSITAISALLAAGIARFLGVNIEASNLAQIIFGIIALIGIIKQMIDHKKVVVAAGLNRER